jgi:nucleotide-binding universal stress UspA family protein
VAPEVADRPGLRRPAPGTEWDGFRIGEPLHAGGTGYIYRVGAPAGRDPGFPLVMKVPAIGAGEPSIGLVGFEMELMIHPSLKGPHVPRFVAAGSLQALPYLVMERIEGESFAALRDRAPLAPAEVARAGAALADALQSLHEQGVIHHDVKPENGILRSDGSAALLDFGFARHAIYPDLIAEERQFEAGTAAYVSPEQLRGRRDDPRSDLYALGALLYELAAGEPPFGMPRTLAGMRDRLWRVPTPPRALNAAIEPWLQEVILRCLEPEPNWRYQSAAHVAFDLRNPAQVLLTGRARRLRGEGIWRQLGRWWRTRISPLAGLTPEAPQPAPVILVAVDTMHFGDERHPVIQWTVRQILSVAAEHRVMCVSVIRGGPLAEGRELAHTESGRHLEHLARLERWVEPLGLPANRLSLHAIASADPAATLVELARANHADLIVLGAPAPAEKLLGWWRSVASGVTANAHCSVHVVRVPSRPTGSA